MNGNLSETLGRSAGLALGLALAETGWGQEAPPTGTPTNAPLPDQPPRLVVTTIDARCFMLTRRSRSSLPHLGRYGAETSPTNDPPIGSTNRLGFVVVAIPNKFEYRRLPGTDTPQKEDVSEMTLKRPDRTIVLVRNRDEEFFEYTVHLLDPDTKKEIVTTPGEIFEFAGRRFRATRADRDNSICVVVDVASGQSYTIRHETPPRRD